MFLKICGNIAFLKKTQYTIFIKIQYIISHNPDIVNNNYILIISDKKIVRAGRIRRGRLR